jgi:hypothetical protein
MYKSTTIYVVCLAMCAVTILLWGCGSAIQHSDRAGTTNDSLFNLSAPAELRQSAAEAASPFCQAAGFAVDLPNSQINPEAEALHFYPTIDTGTGIISPAFAMYRLSEPDYPHQPVVITNSGVDLDGIAWIGFANFERNRWDWQPFQAVSASHYLNIYDPASHVQDGGLLVAIVATSGTSVNWLVAGDTVPPEVVNIQPKLIMTGAQVQFAAEFAYGAANSYHWAFNGGLQPTSSDAAAPVVTALAPGSYSGTLAVENPLGTDSFQFEFEVAPASAIPPLSLRAVANPVAAHVGEGVIVTICCGNFAQQEPMRDCRIYLLLPKQAVYVADSYNVGAPGGGRYATDGLWSLAPVPPTSWLEFPDAWIKAQPTDTPGMKRLELVASPIGNGATTTGGDVCNLQFTFSTPGTYTIEFMPQSSAYPSTYRDDEGRSYAWYSIDNSALPSISITP